ncbi:XdhC family protein [Streptomyces globosus]|uniref:XdhC family protein n=1 Tax=Streptomyces globosus TaxID=68209 RepID=UPI00338C6DFA
MRGLAETAQRWTAEGRAASLARPVAEQGFGPREPAGALLVDARGECAGSLYGGVFDAAPGPGVPYVGALGSRNTTARRRDGLRAAGVPEAEPARVHGPIGLDLGARTPAETEILAALAGRGVRHLRDTDGPLR